MQTPHVYLYAVIPRTYDGDYELQGVMNLPVSLCSQGDLSAAVSLVPRGADTYDLPAHERVMRQLLLHAAVLPAPTSTVLSSQGALHELLLQKQQLMLAELRRFQGLIEVRLQVSERRAAAAPPAMGAMQRYLWSRLSRALHCGGFSVRRLPPAGPEDRLQIACLLHHAFLDVFLLTCESIKRNLGPPYELVVSGSMAPVDFISRDLFGGTGAIPAAGAGEQAAHAAFVSPSMAPASALCESARNLLAPWLS